MRASSQMLNSLEDVVEGGEETGRYSIRSS